MGSTRAEAAAGVLAEVAASSAATGLWRLAIPLPSPERVFRIPPHASLVWRTDIEAPDVGAGPATIRGIVHSTCSLWSGSVVSDPVTVMIRPGAP